MGKTIVIPDHREGFSMKVKGVQLTRSDLHLIAADLDVPTKDILFSNGILTVYNTSDECQSIIDDNALEVFVAMALDISSENISDLTPVKAEPQVIEMDLPEEDED